MAKIIMQEPADQIHSSDPFWLPPKDNILFENYIDTTTNFILGEKPRKYRKPLLVTKNLSRSSMHSEILFIGKDKSEIKRQVFDPNIQKAIHRKESIVLVTPESSCDFKKKDSKLKALLQEQGYDIYYFDLTDPENSDKWDIFGPMNDYIWNYRLISSTISGHAIKNWPLDENPNFMESLWYTMIALQLDACVSLVKNSKPLTIKDIGEVLEKRITDSSNFTERHAYDIVKPYYDLMKQEEITQIINVDGLNPNLLREKPCFILCTLPKDSDHPIFPNRSMFLVSLFLERIISNQERTAVPANLFIEDIPSVWPFSSHDYHVDKAVRIYAMTSLKDFQEDPSTAKELIKAFNTWVTFHDDSSAQKAEKKRIHMRKRKYSQGFLTIEYSEMSSPDFERKLLKVNKLSEKTLREIDQYYSEKPVIKRAMSNTRKFIGKNLRIGSYSLLYAVDNIYDDIRFGIRRIKYTKLYRWYERNIRN